MIGQSLVQTGSRKVSSTTLPRSPARLAGWPYWLVSVKEGAVTLSGAASPPTAWARIGSALSLAWAIAIGATPRRTITTAQVVRTARLPPPPARAEPARRGGRPDPRPPQPWFPRPPGRSPGRSPDPGPGSAPGSRPP